MPVRRTSYGKLPERLPEERPSQRDLVRVFRERLCVVQRPVRKRGDRVVVQPSGCHILLDGLGDAPRTWSHAAENDANGAVGPSRGGDAHEGKVPGVALHDLPEYLTGCLKV